MNPRPMYEVLTVQIGDENYERTIGPIRSDRVLRAEMQADAEHTLDERPGKLWCVVLVGDVPAAWCAVQIQDGVLRCSDNYERRGVGRERGLYTEAYRHRHNTIVAPSGLPAVTYLFAQPIARHEADGWYRTGLAGVSDDGHEWSELRRDA